MVLLSYIYKTLKCNLLAVKCLIQNRVHSIFTACVSAHFANPTKITGCESFQSFYFPKFALSLISCISFNLRMVDFV